MPRTLPVLGAMLAVLASAPAMAGPAAEAEGFQPFGGMTDLFRQAAAAVPGPWANADSGRPGPAFPALQDAPGCLAKRLGAPANGQAQSGQAGSGDYCELPEQPGH